MSNLNIAIIAETVEARTGEITITNGRWRTLKAKGLQAEEQIAIETRQSEGEEWYAAFVNGSAVVLSATNNVMTVTGPITLRLNKPITIAGVSVWAEGN